MPARSILLTSLVTALLTAALVWTLKPSHTSKAEQESAYKRVLRTGVLRCGYYMFKPMTWANPTTGELEGIGPAVMAEFSQKTGIKVNWVEEVGFGNMYTGLQTGRYDAICTPNWPDGNAAKVAAFGETWFYTGIIPVVRADDERFASYVDFNRPTITIATHEGDTVETLVKQKFPLARRIAIPQTAADARQQELDVITGKADVMFGDLNRWLQFDLQNPGKLMPLALDPLQIYPFKIPVLQGEHALNEWLSEVIEELQNNGTIDRITSKYEDPAAPFLRPAKPYQSPMSP